MAADPIADERGETLVELLVTIAIAGIAVVTVLGAIASFVYLTDLHRKQAKAGAYVREYADALETAVLAYPGAYLECGGTAYYTGKTTIPTDIAPYTAAITSVQYRIGDAWVGAASCTTATDTGAQQVTLQVSSPDNRVTETLVIVLRKPCRAITATSDVPADPACA